MGPLLVPQGELARELCVLVDARFDLQGAVDLPRFRKLVCDQGSVGLAIRASRDPANHVVAVRGSKGKNQNELNALLFTRQLHQYKVRLDRRFLLLLVLTKRNLTGDIPQVFALEERVCVLGMIKRKDLCLRLDKSFGVTNMRE